ncbi:thioesterase II family protein [Streptomyces sp. NPDC014734]|uniref:thioesterase II family protein n=1 Tax=Streptomyces sp. NPDC014734 TaxID=3364886 RepID=UPI0036F97536
MTRDTDIDGEDTDRWLRCFRPEAETRTGAERTVICFPHAGGAASYYFGLSATPPAGTEVLVVQYPGRENRLFEEPLASVASLADSVARVLRARRVNRPVLFGHSMGALVAFEVARRLEEASTASAPGPVPAALVVSACAAPSHHADRARLLHGIEEERDADVLARVVGLGGTGRAVAENEELVQLFLPALRADLSAVRGYRAAADATVRCPITVCVADADPDVPVAGAALWGRHTSAGTSVHVFEGDHFYLGTWPRRLLDLLLPAVHPSCPEVVSA